MLTEICKGLWLNPYEIVQVNVDNDDDNKFTYVCIHYRSAPSLLTTKQYSYEDEDTALKEAKRVAELVNKVCYEPPSSDEPLKYENYVCMRCGESKSFGDYPPDSFELGDDGILHSKKDDDFICFDCIDAEREAGDENV